MREELKLLPAEATSHQGRVLFRLHPDDLADVYRDIMSWGGQIKTSELLGRCLFVAGYLLEGDLSIAAGTILLVRCEGRVRSPP